MAVTRRASFSFPRQWSPAIAPTWPVEIDPTADLSGGLRDCALAATGRNYVDGVRPWLPNTSTLVNTPVGPAFQSDGVSTYSQIAYQTGLVNLANFSVGLLCVIPSTPASFGAVMNSGQVSGRNFSIFLANSSPAPINFDGIGIGGGAPSGTTNFVVGGVSAFVASITGTASTFWVNGAGTATDVCGKSEASAAASWTFGDASAGGNPLAAQYVLFATWNRALSQQEAALFGSAPFSMFRPVVRRMYYAAAAAPPTGTPPFLVNWGG